MQNQNETQNEIQPKADVTNSQSDNPDMSSNNEIYIIPSQLDDVKIPNPVASIKSTDDKQKKIIPPMISLLEANEKKEKEQFKYDKSKREEQCIRHMLVYNDSTFDKNTSINLNETPGQNFYRLAERDEIDYKVCSLIDKFFVNFDQKMIFWGLGAERRYREAARTFIEFIDEVNKDFSLLFDHKDESCNIISVLKMYIIENFYQTFHFEEANPYLAITRLEYNGLFQCIHCVEKMQEECMFINTVHESYRDGCCPICNSTYEEKFIKIFNSDEPYVKGGNINSAKFKSLQRNDNKPTILALMPTPKSSSESVPLPEQTPEPVPLPEPTPEPVPLPEPTVPKYKPYFFKPEDYDVTVNSNFTSELDTQDSTININQSGINKYKADTSSYEELNRNFYKIINMDDKYKKAVNRIMFTLKQVLLQVWKQTETLYNDVKDNNLYDLKVEEYIRNAKDIWNKYPWNYRRDGKQFSIYLTLDGIVDVLYIKVNGRSIKENSTNKKRKADEITKDVVQSSKIDEKEESPVTNSYQNNNHNLETNTPNPKRPKLKPFKKSSEINNDKIVEKPPVKEITTVTNKDQNNNNNSESNTPIRKRPNLKPFKKNRKKE